MKLPMPVICQCGFATMDAAAAIRHINSCTPGYPPTPIQADVQGGDNPPPAVESNGGLATWTASPATNMNWEEVGKCNIWRELGVSECDECPGNSKCWTKEA